MLNVATETCSPRSAGTGGRFAEGSTPGVNDTPSGWTLYLSKPNDTPPNASADTVSKSRAGGSSVALSPAVAFTPRLPIRMRWPLPLSKRVPGMSSSGCASRNTRRAYGLARARSGYGFTISSF